MERRLTVPLKADLHGHTRFSGFPEFVDYRPSEAVERAKSVGLQVLAITGHNTLRGLAEAMIVGEKVGVIVVPGVEISAISGLRTPHVLALGVDPTSLTDTDLPNWKSPARIVSWIREVGGLAVAPHATKRGSFICLSHREIEAIGFDAIETVNTRGVNQERVQLAEKLGLPQIGNSDYHLLEQIGLAGTFINSEVELWSDVVEAIRTGRVEPYVTPEIPKNLVGLRSARSVWRQIRRMYSG